MRSPCSSPQHVLVTGATGMVGPALVHHLTRVGYRVRALVRRAPAPGLLPSSVDLVEGDITRPETLPNALEGVNVVFHLAAKLHINDPSPQLSSEYKRVNIEGTRHLAQAAVAAGVERFVHFSTINVYGPAREGRIYHEGDAPEPDTIYARSKLEAERLALATHPGTTVLRLAAVYGPRMSGNYPLLLKALRKGITVMVGDGQNRRTLVYVDDVAHAAIAAARSDRAIHETYNVTDGQVHSFDTIARAMQQALGKRERMLYLPVAPILFGINAVARLSRIIGLKVPISSSLIHKLTEDLAVSGERLCSELDFEPQYKLDDGWKSAISTFNS